MNEEPTVVYKGPIAGVSFGHYKFRPDRLKNRDLVVVPMPENEYDAEAIALKVINGTMALHVGYVPRMETWRVHQVLNAGEKVEAKVTNIDLNAGPSNQAHVTIWTKAKLVPVYRSPKAKKNDPKGLMKPLNPIGTRRILL